MEEEEDKEAVTGVSFDARPTKQAVTSVHWDCRGHATTKQQRSLTDSVSFLKENRKEIKNKIKKAARALAIIDNNDIKNTVFRSIACRFCFVFVFTY